MTENNFEHAQGTTGKMSATIVPALLPCAQVIRANGARYDFSIEVTPSRNKWNFAIRAIDRENRRSSVVNTVNAVLSELLTDEQDASASCWEDTPWKLSPAECLRLMQVASDMLTDERRLMCIEAALDEDRAEGEWANLG